MREKLYLILCKVMLADEEKSRPKPTGQSILRFYSLPALISILKARITWARLS